MCVQYENNSANGLRDVVRKRNTDTGPDGQPYTAENISTSWSREKRAFVRPSVFLVVYSSTIIRGEHAVGPTQHGQSFLHHLLAVLQ